MELIFTSTVCLVIELLLLRQPADAQITMEELQSYKIDPLTLNGTEPYTELTIDQIIMRASGGEGMAQNLMMGENGTVLAELDMMLTQDQFFNLYEQPEDNGPTDLPPLRGKRATRKSKKRSKRKAIRDTILRWDKGIMPYRFVQGHYEDKEIYMIGTAMTEWEKYTCLRFRPSTRSDRNVVRFQNGQGCNSQLGMVGGEQPLNLDKNGCRYKGLYLHEIGHALGLVHEHQLPNRDNYIEILYQNVLPNMRVWFNKYSAQEVDQMKVQYEYSSVMHYGITAFSSNGKSQTIRAKQPDKEKTIGRVYRKELSFTDTKIVNLMYGCASHCDTSTVCYNGGYVDQNCRCICPDGSDSCTQRNPPVDHTCANKHHDEWQCYIWANQGECTRNERFMLDGCQKACNFCGDKKEEGDACRDEYDSSKCHVWKKRGECIVNNAWMKKNCKQTCKLCKNSGPDPEVECNNVHKNKTECDKWATEGECQINSRWMPKNCRKSCHMCTHSEETTTLKPTPDPEPEKCEDLHNSVECKGWADSNECDLNPDWMIPNCRKSCKKCEGDTSGGKTECKNTWDDKQCEGWARDQECMKNKIWMNKNCHKACTKCESDTDGEVKTTPLPTTTQATEGDCKNNHRSDKECSNWAKYGHCQINDWMKKHCAKACNVCKETKITTTIKPDTKTDSGKQLCADKEQHCAAWARHGFCEDNPGTALRICKKSCKVCTADRTECFDKHQLCRVWSRGGQCQRNGGYMLRNCQKSCDVC